MATNSRYFNSHLLANIAKSKLYDIARRAGVFSLSGLSPESEKKILLCVLCGESKSEKSAFQTASNFSLDGLK
jgi:hypothetical protein